MENQVKFKIGQIEFEASGSEQVIEREREVFLNRILPAAIDALQQTQEVNQSPNYIETVEFDEKKIENKQEVSKTYNDILIDDDLSRVSLASFIKRYGEISDKDFVLIAAYYYEKKDELKSFTIEQVKQYYIDARRKEYSNPSMLLNQLARDGYIMDDPGAEKKFPKQYILTSDGLDFIETYQPKVIDETKKKVNKARKTKAKQESAYSDLDLDKLNLGKYPEIKKLDKFKDQMIMMMYIVSIEDKRELFSAYDIAYIMTEIFGISASIDQIYGIFRRNKEYFKKEQEVDGVKMVRYKLFEKGKDYARTVIESNKL